jgi:ribosomal protein S8
VELNSQTYQHVTKQLGNIKRQKVTAFLSKSHVKRVTTFSGLVAKLQQSLNNRESQFIYFSNKKIIAFLTLLREAGVIHNFYYLNKSFQRNTLGVNLSPAFDNRLLVIYLKIEGKHGSALKGFTMFTIPSRPITMSYLQLLEQVQVTGPATLYVLNTQKGLLTHVIALHNKIGGEVVCAIK